MSTFGLHVHLASLTSLRLRATSPLHLYEPLEQNQAQRIKSPELAREECEYKLYDSNKNWSKTQRIFLQFNGFSSISRKHDSSRSKPQPKRKETNKHPRKFLSISFFVHFKTGGKFVYVFLFFLQLFCHEIHTWQTQNNIQLPRFHFFPHPI